MASRRKFSYCSLCLGKESNLQDAFEHKMAIEDLLNIKVCNRGSFPWMICGRCMQKVNDFGMFKCDALKSLKVLKILLIKNPTTAEENDVGEQNLSTGNGSDDLKQEEDEVAETHRCDSEISVKMEEVIISESEETSFPNNIEEYSDNTPEYLQNNGSESEVGDGGSEDDSCSGDLCHDEEDNELRLYLESDSESEIGGQGEGESSHCQIDEPISEKECSHVEEEEISSLEERNSQEAVLQCGGDNSAVAVGEDSPGKCVRRSLRLKHIRTQSVVGSVNPEVGHKVNMAEAQETCETAHCTTRLSKERRIVSQKVNGNTISGVADAPEKRREKQKEIKRKQYHEYYMKLSDEKKKAYNRKKGERRKERLAQMNVEERKSYLERRRDRVKRWFASRTEEEKKEYNRRKVECMKKKKANMTEEERKEFNRQTNENRRKRMANMSVEEKKECRKQKNEWYRRRLASMSEAERAEQRRRSKLRWIASRDRKRKAERT